MGVTFYNKQPSFQCYALHFLCRPQSLEQLSPFDFYSEYKVVYASKTVIAHGGENLINTSHFIHPSYDFETDTCKQAVVKREQKALVKINQKLFTDSANFKCNILTDDTTGDDEIELYSQIVVLLFLPYLSENYLKIQKATIKNFKMHIQLAVYLNQIVNFYKTYKTVDPTNSVLQLKMTIWIEQLNLSMHLFMISLRWTKGEMVMNGIIPDEDNIERINLAELLLLTRIENDIYNKSTWIIIMITHS